MVKRREAYLFLIFVSKWGGGEVIGEELKEKGAKYRNYSTSIPSSPFPNTLQDRGQLQGLKYGLQGWCIACYVPANME
jgi:hypothetical protein